jgi:hypothetical protein
MCACHELEGTYRETIPQPQRLPRSILRIAWDRCTGLERPVCDPSLCPGTGLAQRDRSQSLPACEEASATSTPPQHHHRCCSHTYTCDVHHSTFKDPSCPSLGSRQAAGSHRFPPREARWVQLE